MIQERVLSVGVSYITTETGVKYPTGERNFTVGQPVWTDGDYVFGRQRWGQSVVFVPLQTEGFFELTSATDNSGNYGACLFYHSITASGVQADSNLLSLSSTVTNAYMAYDESNIFFFRIGGDDKSIKIAHIDLTSDNFTTDYYTIDFDASISSIRLVGITDNVLQLECITADFNEITGVTDYYRYSLNGENKTQIDYLNPDRKNEIVSIFDISPTQEEINSSLLSANYKLAFDAEDGTAEKDIDVLSDAISIGLVVGDKTIINLANQLYFNNVIVFGDGFTFINNWVQFSYGCGLSIAGSMNLSGITNPGPAPYPVLYDYVMSTKALQSFQDLLNGNWHPTIFFGVEGWLHLGAKTVDANNDPIYGQGYVDVGTSSGIGFITEDIQIDKTASVNAIYSFTAVFDKNWNKINSAKTGAPTDTQSTETDYIFGGHAELTRLNEDNNGYGGSIQVNTDGTVNATEQEFMLSMGDDLTIPAPGYSYTICSGASLGSNGGITGDQQGGLDCNTIVTVSNLNLGLPTETEPSPNYPDEEYTIVYDIGNDFTMEATGHAYQRATALLIKKNGAVVADVSNLSDFAAYMGDGSVDTVPALCVEMPGSKYYFISNGSGYIFDGTSFTSDGNSYNSHYTLETAKLKLSKTRADQIKTMLSTILSNIAS